MGHARPSLLTAYGNAPRWSTSGYETRMASISLECFFNSLINASEHFSSHPQSRRKVKSSIVSKYEWGESSNAPDRAQNLIMDAILTGNHLTNWSELMSAKKHIQANHNINSTIYFIQNCLFASSGAMGYSVVISNEDRLEFLLHNSFFEIHYYWNLINDNY